MEGRFDDRAILTKQNGGVMISSKQWSHLCLLNRMNGCERGETLLEDGKIDWNGNWELEGF